MQDLNNTKPSNLGGSLIKFKDIHRPSLIQQLKKHREKNKYHKQKLNNQSLSGNSSSSSSSNSSSNSSPNSSPSTTYSLSNTRSNSAINANATNKRNRTFVSNNKLIDTENKKPLHSFLPSPAYPNNNNNNNNNHNNNNNNINNHNHNNNNNNNNNGNFKQQTDNFELQQPQATPPPSYPQLFDKKANIKQEEEEKCKLHKQSTPPPTYEETPLYPDLSNVNDDDNKIQKPQQDDAKLAQQLQQELNRNHNNNHNNNNNNNNTINNNDDNHFALSDQDWALQHELINKATKAKQQELYQHYQQLNSPDLPQQDDDDDNYNNNNNNDIINDQHDENETPEAELDEEEQEQEEEEEEEKEAAIRHTDSMINQEDEDLAFALRLQEEQNNLDDDMKIAMQLQKEEELKAKVERARQSRYRNPNFVDFGSHPNDYQSYVTQRQSLNNDDNDDDNNDNNNNNNNNNNGGWQPSPHDIMINSSHGRMPAVFRSMIVNDNDDDQNMEDILSQFSIYNNGGNIHHHHHIIHGMMGGHHSSLRRHGRHVADDSWQRLPVRKLNGKDIEILKKSDEKKACPICMMDFAINDETRQLPCFHEFHKDCVDKWFQQQNDKGKDASCPLDRKKIKDIANQHVD